MVEQIKILEMKSLVMGEHSNPHNLLGMHKVRTNVDKFVIIRAFIPAAKSVTCVDVNDENKKYQLEKIEENGFFEVKIDRGEAFKYKFFVEGYEKNNNWEVYDPYSFAPLISEYDIYLFREGNNYNVYEKLGSNFMEVDGIKGVLFGIWAPNAKRVSVIGNFNNWDGRTHPLRNINNSGLWELFIPGLENYDMYKYEIKTYDNHLLEKSDPYAKFSELRPGKASFIYDINNYEWQDTKWMSKRGNPVDGPLNIYEVHLGSWKRKVEENNRFLSYKELAHELVAYVKEMGYTHIEIMPIQEHPLDASWGYQVTGYYSPTSRYGSPEEFMYFVDFCHQNDIGVILDWVPAHFPKDENGLANFDGTALYEHLDPRKGEHLEWGTKVFNYGRNEVKNFLIANAIFWIEKYHLDGLRVDAVASMIYLDYGRNAGEWIPNQYGGREHEEAIEFMKHMNSTILDRNPNIIMMAEESTAWAGVSKPVTEGGLGFNLKWNMGWMNDFLSYISKEPIHRSYHHGNLTFGMVYAYTENFVLVLSHDEVVHGKRSLVGKMPGDLWQKFANLRLSFGFMYGHPGKKLMFMGGEFAQFDEWSEERSLDWNLLQYGFHSQMQDFAKDLNHIYKNNKPLWYNDFSDQGFSWISSGDYQRSIVSFVRKGEYEREILIFVCNFTPVTYEDFRIGVPLAGKYKELLNSDNEKYGGSGVVNDAVLESEAVSWDNFDNSISLRLPPLGVVMLEPIN